MDSLLLPWQTKERPHGWSGRGDKLQACHASKRWRWGGWAPPGVHFISFHHPLTSSLPGKMRTTDHIYHHSQVWEEIPQPHTATSNMSTITVWVSGLTTASLEIDNSLFRTSLQLVYRLMAAYLELVYSLRRAYLELQNSLLIALELVV